MKLFKLISGELICLQTTLSNFEILIVSFKFGVV